MRPEITIKRLEEEKTNLQAELLLLKKRLEHIITEIDYLINHPRGRRTGTTYRKK